MKHGKPQKQALAIAYSTKRANMSKGGKMNRVSKHGSSGEIDQSHQVLNSGGMAMNDQSHEVYDHSCPKCMAMGGACMSQGGMAQPAGGEPVSHRPTKDLYPHRKAMAEGGEVDALKPLLHEPKKHNHMIEDEMDRDSRRAMLAEGGEVNELRSVEQHPEDGNEELHPDREAGHDEEDDSRMGMVNYGVMSEESSKKLNSSTRPQKNEHISLVDSIMADRKRMARGGKVEDYESDSLSSDVGTLHGPIDHPDDSDMDNESGLMNASPEDERPHATSNRGPNKEPVHYMDEPDHDSSEASLVAEILKDRKRRRRE